MHRREWHIRQLRRVDEKKLRKLTGIVFKRSLSREYWNWEFCRNPAGFTQAFIAVVGDDIVGQYAVLPVRLKIMGETVFGTLGVDAMTHPKYRHQGMFVALANVLYAALARNGFPITYAFPNEASAPVVFKRLNWSYVCTLPIYVRPINIAKIAEIFVPLHISLSFASKALKSFPKTFLKRAKVSRKGEYNVKWVKRFDDRVDSLWTRESGRYKIAVIRDKAYLNWRYCDNPERDYRIIIAEKEDNLLGYMVVRCQSRFGLKGGMIVDLLVQHDRDYIFHILMHRALDYFEQQNVDLAACMINGDYTYLKWLRSNKFFVLPAKIGVKEWHFGIRLVDSTLDSDFMSNSSNWFLDFGDTDVI